MASLCVCLRSLFICLSVRLFICLFVCLCVTESVRLCVFLCECVKFSASLALPHLSYIGCKPCSQSLAQVMLTLPLAGIGYSVFWIRMFCFVSSQHPRLKALVFQTCFTLSSRLVHVIFVHTNGMDTVLFFNITQKFTNLLVQLSNFLIDLFVGTYRLSSHARLEAFVIQTKLMAWIRLRDKSFM